MKIIQKRNFIALHFPIDENTETLQSVLACYLPLGLEEGNNSWTCWFDTIEWNKHREDIIRSVLTVTHKFEIDVEEIEERDWNAVWEASVQPVKISEHVVVAPMWINIPPKAGQHVIIIDPKMAFGTGHHPTTRLCAALLERTVSAGCTVLDVGTGTGVLCILAAKLGAHRALGIDVDPWAIANAKENVTRNKLDCCVEIQDRNLIDIVETFDIVVANINRNEIIDIMDLLLSRLTTGGALIISGFVYDDEGLMRGILMRKELRDVQSRQEDEWISLVAWKH